MGASDGGDAPAHVLAPGHTTGSAEMAEPVVESVRGLGVPPSPATVRIRAAYGTAVYMNVATNW